LAFSLSRWWSWTHDSGQSARLERVFYSGAPEKEETAWIKNRAFTVIATSESIDSGKEKPRTGKAGPGQSTAQMR